MNTNLNNYKEHDFIFIGGLHKSGTSLLQRLISNNKEVSGFNYTGAFEDEGQHLQNELKSDLFFGELLFGLSEEAYLTEVDFALDPTTADRMFQSWKGYWNLEKRYLLDKSPINIVRTRFLQQAFPKSSFIIVIRDPRTLYMASLKNLSQVSVECFFANWLKVYNTLMTDKTKLKKAVIIPFEDLVFFTQEVLQRVSEFLNVSLNMINENIDPNQELWYREKWNAHFKENKDLLKEIKLPDFCQKYGYETGKY